MVTMHLFAKNLLCLAALRANWEKLFILIVVQITRQRLSKIYSLSQMTIMDGSLHVKSSDNPGKFNLPSQKWLKFGVQVVSKVLNNYTKFYFIRTSMARDLGHWKLLIKSYFLPTWCLATSLGIPKLEYLQTRKR